MREHHDHEARAANPAAACHCPPSPSGAAPPGGRITVHPVLPDLVCYRTGVDDILIAEVATWLVPALRTRMARDIVCALSADPVLTREIDASVASEDAGDPAPCGPPDPAAPAEDRMPAGDGRAVILVDPRSPETVRVRAGADDADPLPLVRIACPGPAELRARIARVIARALGADPAAAARLRTLFAPPARGPSAARGASPRPRPRAERTPSR